MRRFLALTAFILAAILGTAHVASAQPALGPSSTTLAVQVRADSLRVVGRAFPRTDGAGAVDSVRWQWTVNGVALTRTTRRTVDTLMVLRATCPTATTVALTATAYRRNAWASNSATRTAGCRDPLVLDSVVIDTGFVWRGALRVDSANLPFSDTRAGWFGVLRADSSYAMVHIVRSMVAPHPVRGATNSARTTCSDGLWHPLGDTVSVRVAQARAAQWPTTILTAKATAAWLARDFTPWPYMQVWQARCG